MGWGEHDPERAIIIDWINQDVADAIEWALEKEDKDEKEKSHD